MTAFVAHTKRGLYFSFFLFVSLISGALGASCSIVQLPTSGSFSKSTMEVTIALSSFDCPRFSGDVGQRFSVPTSEVKVFGLREIGTGSGRTSVIDLYIVDQGSRSLAPDITALGQAVASGQSVSPITNQLSSVTDNSGQVFRAGQQPATTTTTVGVAAAAAATTAAPVNAVAIAVPIVVVIVLALAITGIVLLVRHRRQVGHNELDSGAPQYSGNELLMKRELSKLILTTPLDKGDTVDKSRVSDGAIEVVFGEEIEPSASGYHALQCVFWCWNQISSKGSTLSDNDLRYLLDEANGCAHMIFAENLEFARFAGRKWKDSLESSTTSSLLQKRGVLGRSRAQFMIFREKLEKENIHI